MNTNRRTTLFTLIAALGFGAAGTVAAQSRVDLRARQTPPKQQGDRNTCQTFGATAAVEAAYKRAGYGDLDLSEQFLNHMGKTFWLHGAYDEVLALGPDGAEGQVGAFGGGGGAPYIRQLTGNQLRLVEEGVFPYRPRDYTPADHPHMANAWDSEFWRTQKHQSDFNLDPRILPRAALKAERTYRVAASRALDARSERAIEAELAAGREVVWDFLVAGTSPSMWRPCAGDPSSCVRGAHSMLLVGYDRSSSDRSQHYFIAKNSWGSSGARADGYTYLSYDYLQYGLGAAVIDRVATPEPWPELANVGRWSLDFDGWRGIMDVYHVPGVAATQLALVGSSETDRRAGAFYDSAGEAFKVNGSMAGNRFQFNIDWADPQQGYGERANGRQFDYFRVDSPTLGELVAGSHRDGDGRVFGGYMRLGGFLASGTATPRPFAASSYVGSRWELHFQMRNATITIDRIDASVLTPAERATHIGLTGTIWRAGLPRPLPLAVKMARANPAELSLRSDEIGAGASLKVRHLSHEPGVAAGDGVDAYGHRYGAVMIRR